MSRHMIDYIVFPSKFRTRYDVSGNEEKFQAHAMDETFGAMPRYLIDRMKLNHLN